MQSPVSVIFERYLALGVLSVVRNSLRERDETRKAPELIR